MRNSYWFLPKEANWRPDSFLLASFLKNFTRRHKQRYSRHDDFCGRAASVGGTRWRTSPRQLKEVIQMTHINVGSVASLGAMAGGEVHS